jgi:hypothetical protein
LSRLCASHSSHCRWIKWANHVFALESHLNSSRFAGFLKKPRFILGSFLCNATLQLFFSRNSSSFKDPLIFQCSYLFSHQSPLSLTLLADLLIGSGELASDSAGKHGKTLEQGVDSLTSLLFEPPSNFVWSSHKLSHFAED